MDHDAGVDDSSNDKEDQEWRIEMDQAPIDSGEEDDDASGPTKWRVMMISSRIRRRNTAQACRSTSKCKRNKKSSK
jgi:hypothetical protein